MAYTGDYIDYGSRIRSGMANNAPLMEAPMLVDETQGKTQEALNAQFVSDITNLKAGGGVDLTPYYTGSQVDSKLANKVDKVSGKGLSTNDYTTDEKNKLAAIASGAQVNVIEKVSVNGTALSITSKGVNIDLSGYATTSALTSGLAGKVDKVDGKGLSTNDYTTAEKDKLAGLSNYSLPQATATQLGGVKVAPAPDGEPGAGAAEVIISDAGTLFVCDATASRSGVMSSGDKAKLDKYADNPSTYATAASVTALTTRVTAIEQLLTLA